MLIYMALIDSPSDKSKFYALYAKYEKLFFSIAYNILRNKQDTEDAVQEAFLQLAKNIYKISDIHSNKTRSYLIIIIRNEALKIYNARKKQTDYEFTDYSYGNADSYFLLSPISRAISRLPAEYGQLLLMKYDNGLSSKEIAQITGSTDGAVRQKLHRAKTLLDKELEKEESEL